ncbi:purine and uridine phosphorylase [Aspergillus sclerotiicarbonarius CBS 121057]|uniref:Purine and uridine phosphorylase n=1 Tax=Aspergillus sclerotiicarbonarius (strain CBS 121057 / IBT 28362) TaxID=1448318 RepID=A0A319DRF3_ASPSB|nr:purine and uridine phosphorylase [Aspergillus sclerotiicarbonarius CBS 121057]
MFNADFGKTSSRMEHQQLHPFENLPKRRKLDHGDSTRLLSHDDYTVGWVCALSLEAAAAMGMLDKVHPALNSHPCDSNSYTLGSINNHNVVIACLPSGLYGTTSAATVASNMFISFGSIRHLLMVGIGGGAPSAASDIRLGDVVVSIPTPRFEGVVQYDYGKTIGEGRFERTGTLNKPSTSLLTAVSNLRAENLRGGSQIPILMSEMLARNPQMGTAYKSPGPHKDLLFVSDYEHDQAKPTCELCDRERLVARSTRGDDRPVVRPLRPDSIGEPATELNILCFEMEAAGLMDNFPCLVIRGVSDYSDSHKKKEWQCYAAATAAAYAKQLLATISVSGPGHVPESAVPRSITAAAHRASMMDALRFDQLESRQTTIKSAHAKTCKWLLQKKEHMDWLDSNRFPEHRGFLWIKGKAGSGKSTMMKFAFQQAVATRHEKTVMISFFFNARGEDLEKTTLGMYRSLLFQLFQNIPELQALFDEVRWLNGEENISWSHTILQHLFRRSIALLGGRCITCFIDALDEYEEEQVRAMIDYIQSLGEHAISSGVQLHVCFSSRHYPHIAVEKGLELVLENQEGHTDDIARYLHSELKIGRSKQAGQIQDEILEKASGIFLWVVLVTQILRREFERGRLHELRKRLREIPAGLSDLFKDILTRDTANMDDLLLIIQWILFAKRPLNLGELYYAILSADPENLADVWDPASTSPDDMSRFLLDTSKGLAEVTKSKDKTVQFIHESVRDFLLKENGLRELWPEHQQRFEALSHDRLKECCHNFLQNDVQSHIPVEDNLPSASSEEARILRESLGEQFPFLEYAVHNLLHHADAAQRDGIHQEIFLQNFDLSGWIRCSNTIERYQIRRHTSSASLLYILAECDLPNLIRVVRKGKPCIDLPGERYRQPLFAAIVNGCEASVRTLLQPDEAF